MALYSEDGVIFKELAILAMFDGLFLNATPTPDTILADQDNLGVHAAIFAHGLNSRTPLNWGDNNRVRLTEASTMTVQDNIFLNTTPTPDTIFLDQYAVELHRVILCGANAGGALPPITGECQDIWGYF